MLIDVHRYDLLQKRQDYYTIYMHVLMFVWLYKYVLIFINDVRIMMESSIEKYVMDTDDQHWVTLIKSLAPTRWRRSRPVVREMSARAQWSHLYSYVIIYLV